jgi:hypothetical protein
MKSFSAIVYVEPGREIHRRARARAVGWTDAGDSTRASSKCTTREILDQELADYITDSTPTNPSIQGRITCVDPNPAIGPATVTLRAPS